MSTPLTKDELDAKIARWQAASRYRVNRHEYDPRTRRRSQRVLSAGLTLEQARSEVERLYAEWKKENGHAPGMGDGGYSVELETVSLHDFERNDVSAASEPGMKNRT